MSDYGLAFRATSGFVSDATPFTYCLQFDAYPVTRGGFTFGWTTNVNFNDSRDRNSGIDHRLAGMAIGGALAVCQIDVTAGTYDIQSASGDASYSGATAQVTVKDNATTRFSYTGTTGGSDRFIDALSVSHPTSWIPSSAEQQSAVSISSGTLNILLGVGGTGSNISFLSATASGGGGPAFIAAPPYLIRQAVNRAATY